MTDIVWILKEIPNGPYDDSHDVIGVYRTKEAVVRAYEMLTEKTYACDGLKWYSMRFCDDLVQDND